MGSFVASCEKDDDEGGDGDRPVERYADAFRELRPEHEDRLVVAGIVGIPNDESIWRPGEPLEDLADLQRINPANETELLPSCQTERGLAMPPVRIVDLIYRFGDDGVLFSGCRADWPPALQAITAKIQSKLIGACMTRELPSTHPEVCRVVETLDDDRDCPHLADAPDETRTEGWQVDLGLDESGRRRCEILHADLDGDGCPDGIGAEECGAGFYGPDSNALQGWFIADIWDCDFGQFRPTGPDTASGSSELHMECRSYEASE